MPLSLCYAHHKDTRTLRYDTQAVDYDTMCTELEDIDWANIMNHMNTLDAWNFFTTVFQETIDKFVPLRKSGNKISTYMKTEAFDLRKLKCKLWKRYCLSKADGDYTAFKDISNKLRSLTRNLRCKHEANLVSNIAKNPKSFWLYVNTSLKTRPDIDAIKCIDGSLASSDQEKADLLNSYFSSVFTREDLSNIPNFEVNEDIPLPDNISISPSMVWREINKLKSEKSAGPDGWLIQVLKQCLQQISLPLSILFNKSFQSGHLPRNWKIAYITPIHKKGSRNVAGNYRPVSLTSTVVKLMESVIKSSIFDHLISNNLIY